MISSSILLTSFKRALKAFSSLFSTVDDEETLVVVGDEKHTTASDRNTIKESILFFSLSLSFMQSLFNVGNIRINTLFLNV